MLILPSSSPSWSEIILSALILVLLGFLLWLLLLLWPLFLRLLSFTPYCHHQHCHYYQGSHHLNYNHNHQGSPNFHNDHYLLGIECFCSSHRFFDNQINLLTLILDQVGIIYSKTDIIIVCICFNWPVVSKEINKILFGVWEGNL